MADARLQAELNVLTRKLNSIADNAKAQAKKAFHQAAPPIIEAAKANAPQHNAPHHRYKNGKKVATYYPGNLRRSIQILPLRRTANAVLIGPKLGKGASGEFRGRKVDGYYAHFVEYGTETQTPQPFMRPAAAKAGPQALNKAVQILKRIIDDHARRLSV